MRVAVAQVAPSFLDRRATLRSIATTTLEAGHAGAQLVAFGEALVPGYPVWVSRTDGARFDASDQKALYQLYVEQAVRIEDGDLDGVREAALAAGCAVILGVIEKPLDRGGHSLFCSCVALDGRGEILSVHRKLMPTFEERLVWSHGDGAGLAVHEIGGLQVSALLCWENWMPLARAALYAGGTELHVMLWPGSEQLTRDITRFAAREGRCFVVSAGALLRESDIPPGLPGRGRLCRTGETLYDGGSCIAAPDGEWLVPPQTGVERLIVADLDHGMVSRERQNFDPAGHYARPDVLRLTVNRERQRAAHVS